jgi:hypothetical protein
MSEKRLNISFVLNKLLAGTMQSKPDRVARRGEGGEARKGKPGAELDH